MLISMFVALDHVHMIRKGCHDFLAFSGCLPRPWFRPFSSRLLSGAEKHVKKSKSKGLGLKGVNTLCRFGHAGKVESEPVRVGQKSEQPPCTHVCWRCSTFEHLRLKPQIGWTRMNIWYFDTSSSRASRWRKFQKKKELYSKERICL